MPDDGPGLITDLFYKVANLIPSDQLIYTLPTNISVAEAFEFLESHGFSQIPVVTPVSNKVVGVFSYRSFSKGVMELDGKLQPHEKYGDMTIGDFLEPFRFVDQEDNWESILQYLDKDDGILVGARTDPDTMHIITAIDVVNFLHQVALPFVSLVEIELSIRKMIGQCVSDEELRDCIDKSLSHFYSPETLPTCVEEMTFDNYVQVICHGDNWHHFEGFFGNSQGQRARTRTMLEQLRELRNDVFHFKRQIEDEELRYLKNKRNLLKQRAEIFEGE